MQKILHAGLKIVHIGLKNAEKHYIWTIFGHICLKLGQSEFSRKIETPSLNE